jgi:serine/threonine protein kinase
MLQLLLTSVLRRVWMWHNADAAIGKVICRLLLHALVTGVEVNQDWQEKCRALTNTVLRIHDHDIGMLQYVGLLRSYCSTSDRIETQRDSNEFVSHNEDGYIHLPSVKVPVLTDIQIISEIDADLWQGKWRGMSVAVKLPHSKSTWVHEIENLSKLRHERVVNLLGVSHSTFVIQGQLLASKDPPLQMRAAIVLEYMMKGDLRAVLNDEHAILTVFQKVIIAKDVSEAMQFLHARKVFHRALKSIYVLINQDKRAKLTGFGGSVYEQECSDITAKGKRLADNQQSSYKKMTLDEKNERIRADVIAFGIILWEIITGQHPTTPWLSLGKGKNFTQQQILNNFPLTAKEESSDSKGLIPVMKRCFSYSTHDGSIYEFEELAVALANELERIKQQASEIPDGFICPITQDIMRDPVSLPDGHSYERKAIMDWLKTKRRSPLTNEEFQSNILADKAKLLVGNFSLKSAIEDWHRKQK